jgi:hypothetical protein
MKNNSIHNLRHGGSPSTVLLVKYFHTRHHLYANNRIRNGNQSALVDLRAHGSVQFSAVLTELGKPRRYCKKDSLVLKILDCFFYNK